MFTLNIKSLLAATALILSGLEAASAIHLPPHAARNLHSELLKRTPGQVVTSCTVPNTAALTFDDGPHWFTYDVSKALIAAGGKGTFFFSA